MNTHILQTMGITRWKLRDTNNANYVYIAMNNAQGKTVGLLVADIDANHAIASIEQEKVLQKIAYAITPFVETQFMTSLHCNDYAVIILLGKKSEAWFDQNTLHASQVIRCNAVTDLIENLEYKKNVWNKIKPLRELFS